MQFHVHVVESSAKDAMDMVAFRDYPRNHHEEASRYAALKRHLAASYVNASEYAAGKTAHVQEIVRLAGGRNAEDTDGGD